ncbi:PocR ligand-binding domain-containing protein [Blautia schinkii]|nr:PocR ligand-binding domain-containing protein [Blautia schinkii]
MMESMFHLEKILDISKWQALQDSLAQVTGMAIITVDYKGIPITIHSSCTPFCQKVRDNPHLLKRCQRCDSRGGLEAVRINQPYIYKCHYDIIDIAIPITVSDKYVGALMAGQIRTENEELHEELEQILQSGSSLAALSDSDELQKLYNDIPVLPFEKIKSISEMLSRLCNYIVDEAKNKNYILEMYENLSAVSSGAPRLQNPESEYITQLKDTLSNVVTNAYIQSEVPSEETLKHKVLLPAFDFIYSNKGKMVTLNEAAELCHLSPSYFSRIFTRETGESFSAYTSKLKISWAKQLLERTDLSVTQISDELGFNEPGYFIKTFKKIEGLTPLVYRKYCPEKKSSPS